jgi:hypothetical protein
MKRRRRELGWIEDYDFERKFVVEVAETEREPEGFEG